MQHISIPEGAIKRRGCVHLRCYLISISIPEGAIKRPLNVPLNAGTKLISIPEGAIKRFTLAAYVRVVSGFQYPKVQLKAVSTVSGAFSQL